MRLIWGLWFDETIVHFISVVLKGWDWTEKHKKEQSIIDFICSTVAKVVEVSSVKRIFTKRLKYSNIFPHFNIQ